MGSFHQWRPIKDIPPQLLKSLSLGVEEIRQIWQNRRAATRTAELTELLRQQVNRRWAIETGVLEDLYKISRGATESLILHGLNPSLVSPDETNLNPDRTVALIQDHVDALDVIFSAVKGERPLTEGFIKELHASLVRNQKTYVGRDARGELFEVPLEGGVYKTQPNSVKRADGLDHEYCPPIHVPSEMDQLVKMHLAHRDAGVPPAIQAAWLHHRFTQIHPFPDGNGRVARALASMPLIAANIFPLVVDREEKSSYINVLEIADGGDLEPLAAFIVNSQRKILESVLAQFNQLDPADSIDELISGAAASFDQRVAIRPATPATVLSLIDAVSKAIELETRQVASKIAVSFSGRSEFRSSSDGTVGQSPVLAAWLQARSLRIRGGWTFNISSPGTLDCLYLFVGEAQADSGFVDVYQVVNQIPPESEPFKMNYLQTPEQVLERFQPWLEARLKEALVRWRASL